MDLCIVVPKSTDVHDCNSFHYSWTITKIPIGKSTGYVSSVSIHHFSTSFLFSSNLNGLPVRHASPTSPFTSDQSALQTPLDESFTTCPLHCPTVTVTMFSESDG